MAHASDSDNNDLIVLLQDGTRLTLHRNEHDTLVVTGFTPAADSKAYSAGYLPLGRELVGFGPWPSWDINKSMRTATIADDESGLFEPERLFVLREQYAFFFAGEGVKPLSIGPIHKAWWPGSETTVQARQVTHKH